MAIYVGTSGFSYKEWKGPFYPEDLPAKKMLSYYASRLGAVEINNTFYRLPKASVLEGWAAEVPAGFRFSIKASRRITHMKRLKDAGDETGYLLETVRALGDKLGVVLFQLPPNLKADLDRLREFLTLIPGDIRAAFEFRHPSWLEADETVDALHGAGAAVCVAETDEGMEGQMARGPGWGYLRLRKTAYADSALQSWADAVRGAGWDEGFVFFKHEDAGAGPKMGERFVELLSG